MSEPIASWEVLRHVALSDPGLIPVLWSFPKLTPFSLSRFRQLSNKAKMPKINLKKTVYQL